MLSRINELALACTFTRHCYRWFAIYRQPFMCYSSIAPFIPLSSFAQTSKGMWKVFLWWVILIMSRDSCPDIFIMGRLFHQMNATFLSRVGHTCVPSLCFPRIDFVAFLSKETPHILLLLHCTLSLESKTKRKLLQPLYGKTPFTSKFHSWLILLLLGERLFLYRSSLLD